MGTPFSREAVREEVAAALQAVLTPTLPTPVPAPEPVPDKSDEPEQREAQLQSSGFDLNSWSGVSWQEASEASSEDVASSRDEPAPEPLPLVERKEQLVDRGGPPSSRTSPPVSAEPDAPAPLQEEKAGITLVCTICDEPVDFSSGRIVRCPVSSTKHPGGPGPFYHMDTCLHGGRCGYCNEPLGEGQIVRSQTEKKEASKKIAWKKHVVQGWDASVHGRTQPQPSKLCYAAAAASAASVLGVPMGAYEAAHLYALGPYSGGEWEKYRTQVNLACGRLGKSLETATFSEIYEEMEKTELGKQDGTYYLRYNTGTPVPPPGIRAEEVGGKLAFEEVQKLLSAGRVILAADDASNHWLIIVGYADSDETGDIEVILFDPQSGELQDSFQSIRQDEVRVWSR
ncbi:hypothetical protein [Streptomyces sp. NPDC047028]|uniref:hypothetical protein n=1 Tax=Streptomyces sp. NPDC047028 TaxID=3155793 RepID=UPI0033EBF211